MAKTFGFLKIGEANAEIEKLTTERDSLKARAEAAEQNAADVADQAEKTRKESEGAPNIQKLLDDEKSAHAITKAALEKANTELNVAKAELADVPAKIEALGGRKAQQIMAAIGQPAIASAPSATPAAPSKTELKGLSRTKAAFEAQLKSK